MPRCGAKQYSPLKKGAARSDSGREAPGGCPVRLSRLPRQPPEGFAFFPLFGKWDFQRRHS